MSLFVGFLMTQDTKKIIDLFYFQLVSDMELFNNYPWGHMYYDLTLDYLKSDFKTKYQERIRKNKITLKKYNFYSCPHIFHVRPSWFFFFLFQFV